MRRRTSAIVLAAAVLLAACGGSSGSSSSNSSGSPAPAGSSSGSVNPGGVNITSGSSGSSGASGSGAQSAGSGSSSATTTGAATSGAQGSAASTSSAQSSAARVPDTNVRLPATFTIRAGGVLDPPEIAAPKHTDIALSVKSGDGRTHDLVLETPHRYRATVRPGVPAKLLLRQLPDGSYAIVVDHVTRGRLVVGVAPGP